VETRDRWIEARKTKQTEQNTIIKCDIILEHLYNYLHTNVK